MAQLEVPPLAAESRSDSRPEPASSPSSGWAGDDAVPRGLAVASAVTLRVIIVIGGSVLLALFAKRMLVVVLPVIIALLLATLLTPLARWLRTRNAPPALAAAVAVLLAFVVFLGLWGLVIPPFVTQVPDVVENVQQGAGQIGDAAAPLGLSDKEVQGAIGKNAARKVSTISGSAIGTPTSTSTMPISTASIDATRNTPCT